MVFHYLLGIEKMKPDDMVILELSSFQLIDMKVSPNISVVTNVSPNHLDIHKSYDEYIDAKKNIFKFQKENDMLILNYDNDITRSFEKEANGKVCFFSSKKRLEDGAIYDEGIIKLCENKLRKHILNTKALKLKGVHNFENICAAILATKRYVDTEKIMPILTNFSGVEHRLEYVRTINDVKWYNDSIGSSPTRTIAGLNSFDEKIVLIAGGYDKHLDYAPIAKPILEHVSSLILFGDTAQKIQQAVEKEEKGEKGDRINIYRQTTLEGVVKKAYEVAKPGEIVLFSPASASFDMFKNFMERGEAFKKIVNSL